MSRQLRSVDEHIRAVAGNLPMPRVRRAFLVGPSVTLGRTVLVQLSDPALGARGAIVRANVRPGLILPSLADGTPVQITTRHGKVEVTG